jgi:hypothetical protein
MIKIMPVKIAVEAIAKAHLKIMLYPRMPQKNPIIVLHN